MGIFEKLFGTQQSENKAQNLLDTLPILRLEDNKIILKDGRVAIGFEFIGSPFESMQAEDYEAYGKTFEGAALTLPENYIIQKIDVYANAQYPFGRDEKAYDKKGFFEKESIKYFGSRPVLRQTSYIFIISNTNNNHKNTALTNSLSRGSRLYNPDFKGIETRVEKIEIYGKSFMDTLLSTNWVKAKRMFEVDIRNLYYKLLNLDFRDEVIEPNKEILNQYNAISIGEKRLNVISLEEQGNEIYYSIPNDYNIDSCFTWKLGLYLQFPHITVTHFYIENSREVIKSLERKKMISSNTGILGGEEARQKSVQLDEYIKEALANQTKFVSISLQVLVYTLSELAREKNVQQTADAFRSTYGLKPLVETFDSVGNFFSCLPGASGYNNRWVLCMSNHASCYINPCMEFASKKQGDYVADRFRNLVYIDLFNRELNNQNGLIIGPPGSGKSFTMGHFIVQRHERKERQIGIDVGGTYKNIFEALGSNDPNSDVRYYEYSPEKPIKFNPFLCPVNDGFEYLISDDKVGFIITMLNLIKNGSKGKWNNQEWSVLQMLIPLYYKELGEKAIEKRQAATPNLIGFVEWLNEYSIKNKSNENFKRIAERFDIFGFLLTLEPFVKGKYKELLNSEDTLDISDYNLVCFDMARVKDDERLYPLVSLLLMELSMDVIRKYPEDKKHFFMDEAWSMLSDSMGDFVEYLFRTIRKCNGAMTIITQGVDELNTHIGAVIKNNAETKVILNHTNEQAIIKVGTSLGFTQSEIELIKSIRVNTDCREVFIKQGNNAFVFVLEVPPTEHAILTSNPVERNHLNKLKKMYDGNTQFAVKQWEEDKKNNFFDNK